MLDENLHYAAESMLAWELRKLLLQFSICFQPDLGQVTFLWFLISLFVK